MIVHSPEEEYRSFYYLYRAAVKHFLEATALPWLIRVTEDCFVNIALLAEYVSRLQSVHDPYSKVVVQGQVLFTGITTWFVHGGSGWLFSRAAAVAYWDQIEALDAEYAKLDPAGDDVMIFEFVSRLADQLDPIDIDAPEFIGGPLSDRDIAALNGEVEFPECHPEVERRPADLRRLNRVVFWHSGREDNFPMLKGRRAQERADLAMDFGVRPTVVCRVSGG